MCSGQSMAGRKQRHPGAPHTPWRLCPSNNRSSCHLANTYCVLYRVTVYPHKYPLRDDSFPLKTEMQGAEETAFCVTSGQWWSWPDTWAAFGASIHARLLCGGGVGAGLHELAGAMLGLGQVVDIFRALSSY